MDDVNNWNKLFFPLVRWLPDIESMRNLLHWKRVNGRGCVRARAHSRIVDNVVWLRPGEMLINTILYFYGNILNIGFQGPVHNLYEYTQTAAIKAAKWEITCSCGWCGTKPNHITQTSTCNVITLQIEPHGKRPHVDLGENRCDEHNLYCRSPLASTENIPNYFLSYTCHSNVVWV